jgi:hypothetical protein
VWFLKPNLLNRFFAVHVEVIGERRKRDFSQIIPLAGRPTRTARVSGLERGWVRFSERSHQLPSAKKAALRDRSPIQPRFLV